MAMGPPHRYAPAGVRVNTKEGRLHVAFPALGDDDGEIAVDVGLSQLARLAEACRGEAEDTVTPEPEMSEEDLEGLKGEIMKRTRDHKPFYPGKIAGDLGLELRVVMRAIKSLEGEGKLVESEYG